MKYTRLLVFFVLALAACSQTPERGADAPLPVRPLNFGTKKVDGAFHLAHHSRGVYVAGVTEGRLHSAPQGEFDVFIRKLDTSGKLLWGQQFGTGRRDYITGIANDSDDNVYIAGVTSGNLAGSKGGEDSFVRKYSPDGRILWTVQFGTRGGDYTSGVAVHGSSVYAVGVTEDYNTGSLTGFVRKFASNGRTLWQEPISGYSFVNDVATDNRGNIYIVGVRATSTEETLFLRKYAPDRSILWTKPFRGDLFSYSDLAVDGSSVYVAGSEYVQGTDRADLKIIKFRTAASRSKPVVITFNLGDSVSVYDISACGGEIVVGGQLIFNLPNDYTDGFAFKLTPSGGRVWLRRQATAKSDVTVAVRVTTAGVYAAGYTDGKLGSNIYGLGDAFITRLRNSDGATVWVR